jgi:flagellar motility protein MotE (MotC chaperone)
MPLQLINCRAIGLLTCAAAALAFSGMAADAQSPRRKPMVEAGNGKAQPPADSTLYCRNITEAASDARLQWQTWKLVSLEARLRGRIEELQRTEKDFEEWVQRENLLNEVEDQVVSIIGRMRPEAAAAQLSTTDEEAAVGVLLKLKARVASSILDEMEPSRAAQLTQSMMGLASPEPQRSF